MCLFSCIFLLQVLMPHSILLSLSLYSGVSIVGIFTVLLLPIETKGRALQVRNTMFKYSVKYSWTSLQRPPLGRNNWPLQRGGRCREVSIRVKWCIDVRLRRKILAVVERWSLVEVRLYFIARGEWNDFGRRGKRLKAREGGKIYIKIRRWDI